MLRSALLFVIAVLLALTAGRAFWVWLGESPCRVCFFLVAAFGLGTVGVLVTVLVSVPINERIAGWNPSALPSGYEDVLRRWWNWHIVRLITSVAAMCSVFVALLARGSDRVVPVA